MNTNNHALTTSAQAGLPAVPSLDSFHPLTKYESERERVDHIACISGGYKDAKGIPQASRDGTIYLHDPEGRAPGLAAILAENGGKSLTITMPSNDIRDFVGQSFRLEGRSRLEAYGDAKSITEIKENGDRLVHPVGTERYEALKAKSKVATNITFYLASYDEHGMPVIIFPDGLGAYRLRTTSPNTLGNLTAALKRIQDLTGGPFAGIPLEVSLVNRSMADPKGMKRAAPVFVFTLKPPRTIELSSRNFRPIAEQAQREITAGLLQLPPADHFHQALSDWEALEGAYDPAEYRKQWFGVVSGTSLEDDDARHSFISDFTGERFDSLAAYLEQGDHADARALIAAAEAYVEPEREANQGAIAVEAELVTSEPAPDPNGPVSDDQVEAIGRELARVGWSQAKGRQHLKKHYGKEARAQLTHAEAEELLGFLAQMHSAEQGAA